MARPISPARRRLMQLAYAAFGVIFVLFKLLPLDTVPARIAGPDLIAALTFAWVLRRPYWVPAPLIAAVALFADIMFQQPPGLRAALLVLAAEWLRRRSLEVRDRTMVAELLESVFALAFVTMAERMLLALFLLPVPGITLTLSSMFTTAVTVPVILALSRAFLGMRRLAPGELDGWGRPI